MAEPTSGADLARRGGVATATQQRSVPASPPPGPATARARLYGIDGLRFLAAMGVVLYHYVARESIAWGGAHPVEVFPHFGQRIIYTALAPELFFVISGFVILMTAWGRDVPHVVASRVARLYPSYWVAVIATSILLLWIWPEGKDITLGQALVNLTMLQSLFEVGHVDGVYWTLWTELRFYLLIVAFVAIGMTRRRILAFCALWPLAAWAAQTAGVQYAAMFLISGYAPLFAGGMLLYVIYREGHRWAPWLLLAGNTVLAVHHIVPAQLASIGRNTAYQPSATALTVAVVGCFALVAALTLTRLRHLRWAWLAKLGMLTYPIYLTHEFWGWWLIHILHPHLGRWPTLVITCLVAVGVAWVIYHGFEKRVSPRMRKAIDRGLRRAGADRRNARRDVDVALA